MKIARKMKLRANPKRSEKVTEAMGILKKDIKKEKDDDSPTIVATVVKRGRGRPPLNKSSSDKSPVPGSSSSSQGKGRGPGRPPKSLSLDKSPIKEEPIELDQSVDSEEEGLEFTEDDDISMDMDKSDSTVAVEPAKIVDDNDGDDAAAAIIEVTTMASKSSTSKDDEEVEIATENSDEQSAVGEDETFDTVESTDSNKASTEPQQKKPETKTRKIRGADDDDEDYVPTPTPAKRGRPPSLKTADSSIKNLAEKRILERKSSLVDKDKDKDDRSFERFYQKTKDSCVVSERWSFGGVLWDPTKKMKVMAASEVDVASSGNIRLKRCIQVYEDMSVKVFIEGADMTRTFSSGAVKNSTEVAQLIHKVATAKICSGIKNFGTTDKIYFPHCVLRGEIYYAPECPVVIDYGVVGPLCPHCNRLRNTIHRRNVKETNLLISKFNRPQVKNVKSKFAKLLYSVLTDLVEASSIDAQRERKKLRRMIPSDAKEYPFQSDSSGSADGMEGSHRQMQHFQYIKSDPGSNISISTTSASEYIRLGKSYGDQNDMMTINVMSGSGHKTAYKVRGSDQNYSNVPGTSGSLSQNEMQVVEQFVLGGHDVGNVIFQNSSGDFTLAEGQEYELIGEADPNNPIQVLEVLKDEADSNNAIEIIEVDDQTLAQLTSQNMSNIIIQEPSSFEVQEIDVNDPNFRHLVKAFNPSTVVYQS